MMKRKVSFFSCGASLGISLLTDFSAAAAAAAAFSLQWIQTKIPRCDSDRPNPLLDWQPAVNTHTDGSRFGARFQIWIQSEENGRLLTALRSSIFPRHTVNKTQSFPTGCGTSLFYYALNLIYIDLIVYLYCIGQIATKQTAGGKQWQTTGE